MTFRLICCYINKFGSCFMSVVNKNKICLCSWSSLNWASLTFWCSEESAFKSSFWHSDPGQVAGGDLDGAKVDNSNTWFWWVHMLCHGEVGIKQTECLFHFETSHLSIDLQFSTYWVKETLNRRHFVWFWTISF